MTNKELKLSERMQDTQNRRCDNNDIDYGYNMAIDDFIGEVEKLEQIENELFELVIANIKEIGHTCDCDSYLYKLQSKQYRNYIIDKMKCGKCGSEFYQKRKITKNKIKKLTKEELEKFEYEQKSNTFGT
jgi:hypothetical protein